MTSNEIERLKAFAKFKDTVCNCRLCYSLRKIQKNIRNDYFVSPVKRYGFEDYVFTGNEEIISKSKWGLIIRDNGVVKSIVLNTWAPEKAFIHNSPAHPIETSCPFLAYNPSDKNKKNLLKIALFGGKLLK